TGVLYVKKGTALFPLFHGGNQEQGIRPGTENLAGAVAMAKALRLIKAREANDLPSLQDKQKRLIKGLAKIPNVCVNTPARSAPHIVNFSVPRSEEHTSELQSRFDLVCRLLLEKKKKKRDHTSIVKLIEIY